jgi:hypothetical protein
MTIMEGMVELFLRARDAWGNSKEVGTSLEANPYALSLVYLERDTISAKDYAAAKQWCALSSKGRQSRTTPYNTTGCFILVVIFSALQITRGYNKR